VLKASHEHEGAAFIEIFQNCIVYNDKVFEPFTARATAAETQIHVQHGAPLLFGKELDKGLAFDPKLMRLRVIDAKASPSDVLEHDQSNPMIAQLLINMPQPEFPVALGVIYRQERSSFERQFRAHHPTQLARTAKVADVLRQGRIWQVD